MMNRSWMVNLGFAALLTVFLVGCADDTGVAPDQGTSGDAIVKADSAKADAAKADAAKSDAAKADAAKADAAKADGPAKGDAAKGEDAAAKVDTKSAMDKGATADQATADLGIKVDAPVGRSCLAFIQTAKCGITPSNYTDARFNPTKRVVEFGGTKGNTYAPKCLRINVGDKVTFKGTFGSHPLKQTCGPNTAITGTVRSGLSNTFTFTKSGYYGYYCTFHGTQVGTGMAGVIRVGI